MKKILSLSLVLILFSCLNVTHCNPLQLIGQPSNPPTGLPSNRTTGLPSNPPTGQPSNPPNRTTGQQKNPLIG
jgi:hypothetical protein